MSVMPLTSKKKKIKIEEAEACDTQALNYTSLLGCTDTYLLFCINGLN
jgi:hypothetical protein